MINILFVDDNLERIRSIKSTLPKGKVKIEYVTTKNEALRKFASQIYDLAIIDIMLPDNLDAQNPNQKAGIELIQAFDKRNINPPCHIIGVTSDDETFSEYEKFFNDRLFPIIKWNPTGNSDWKNKINRNIDYLYSAKYKKKKDVEIEIAIITAVEDEFNAVWNCYDNWEKVENPNDPGTYFITHAINSNGQEYAILLSLLSEMGLTSASNLTTKIINIFSPKKIFMVGICGGIKGQVDLGDLVIANMSWDYGSGKIKPTDENEKKGHYYKFEPSPNQISINASYNNLKFTTVSVIDEFAKDWNTHHRDKPMFPKLHLGPMPSGASVICDESLFKEIIRPQHRKCVALDMETYGVYYACENSLNSQIKFLSIKSVSDFADEEKSDDYHEFCCQLSATYLKKCLDSELL